MGPLGMLRLCGLQPSWLSSEMCEVCGTVLDLLVRSAVTPLPKQDKCMLCFHWGWQSLVGCGVCVGLIAESYTCFLRSHEIPAVSRRTDQDSKDVPVSSARFLARVAYWGTGYHEGHVCELWLSKTASLQACNLNHVS